MSPASVVVGGARGLAVLLCLMGSLAAATEVSTEGGLSVRSDDGRFEFKLGGRIHFDLDLVHDDPEAPFGSSLTPENSTLLFRRARLSFSGKAFGWEYLFVPDFAQSFSGNLRLQTCTETPCTFPTPGVVFQELSISRSLLGGRLILGQFTPARSIEDHTGSNDLTMMERAITSALGVYRAGVLRLFVMGGGYEANPTPETRVEVSVFGLRRDDSLASEGFGGAARVTWRPFVAERRILHVGASVSAENPDGPGPTGNVGASLSYVGIRGPQASMGGTTGGRSARHATAELAGTWGAFYFQGEGVLASFGQVGQRVDRTTTWLHHATWSWNVFGESKPYDSRRGSFKNLTPRHSFGALELALRHEFARNLTPLSPASVESVLIQTVGANYYFTPNVRMMANVIFARARRLDGALDQPRSATFRMQMSW
ncbi:OprO/OprP family phosphate-selective porin [Myxococcus sp. K15C18031901]|uniref:OprO/OprP family phosphate-selective porin n=1 Tax=Myxococcus dinghuensis TaxID=2906761 RepID=UPI0020A707B3|nr:porin [Myxococcus dinghuensis]MCP3098127.1 OprO/OprP family phosphate-selective porin [Myxococcus dinghuensis]